MNEIWKDIPDFEGLYQASNLGRIRSVELTGIGIGKGCYRLGTILKGEVSTYGKTRYTLRKDNKPHRIFGSVLVAKTFPEICGEWFEGCQVHHKDQNPSNNVATNLVCLSQEDHINTHFELGKWNSEKNYWYGKHLTDAMKKKMAKSKSKPIWQIVNGERYAYWFSVTDCEKETGMDKASINRCCLGKQHTAYGCCWEYAKRD